MAANIEALESELAATNVCDRLYAVSTWVVWSGAGVAGQKLAAALLLCQLCIEQECATSERIGRREYRLFSSRLRLDGGALLALARICIALNLL